MSEPLTPEESGRVILNIFRGAGVGAGEGMLFPAISARFMQSAAPRADLSAGIQYLVERGYLRPRPDSRIAYVLTDAGSAARS